MVARKNNKKFNWHSKRYRDKKREIAKRAPSWLFRRTSNEKKQVKDGLVTITLEKLPVARYEKKVTDLHQREPRFELVIDAPYMRDLVVAYYYNKPEFDFIGEYSIAEFLDILPQIPDDVINQFKKYKYYTFAFRSNRSNQLAVERADYNRLRDELYRERHWYDGMVQDSTGRQQLHQDLKKVTQLYNRVLENDTTDDNLSLKEVELVKPFVCDCEVCMENFGEPTVIDEDFVVPFEAVEWLHEAEKLEQDLKKDYEDWGYEY